MKLKAGDVITFWNKDEATKAIYRYARFGILTKKKDDTTLIVVKVRDDSEDLISKSNGLRGIKSVE